MKEKLLAIVLATLSLWVGADGHKSSGVIIPESVPQGAFATLMVAAKNPKDYTAYLASQPQLFENIGVAVAGVCITHTGADYPGQMMVWSGYPSLERAIEGLTKYDPSDAPKKLSAMRDVKYNAIWKPLKQFDLAPTGIAPGFERVMRVKVEPEKLTAFVAAANQYEEEAKEAGIKLQVGVFLPIGGGPLEADTLHVRFVAPSASETGARLDNMFASGIDPNSGLAKMYQMMTPVSDTLESCEQLYTATQ
ncbi:MAG: hypothetical protein CMP95_09245 [Gammaproteobacteria bacterium]|uniref:DUF1330 domain-containing protein n=1 Tax=OM182 bacterium TaxID=2510334 RepID=A0A520RZ46_9GAMM|nr:hypothetical protein [Gammaproteobacteria bacterium]RZO75510.1 MAG: hypothetical protein EVA68_06780 [OM182 bacterium]